MKHTGLGALPSGLLLLALVGTLPAALAQEIRPQLREVEWGRLGPELLKKAEPVVVVRNPLQQARNPVSPLPSVQNLGRERARELRRLLDAEVRGIVAHQGRQLLLFGARVLGVGQEIPLQPGRDKGTDFTVRIKALEGGRVLCLLRERNDEDAAWEEWAYQLPEFLSQR